MTQAATSTHGAGFAREYLAQLERLANHAALPRVRALHLPPPSAKDSKAGEFCAVELDDGSLGLSYVLLDDTLLQLASQREALGVEGADALQLARQYAHGRGVQRTLGFATANALTRWLFDRAGYLPDTSTDSIGQLAPSAADHVGMIGFFTPLVPRIVAAGARLTIAELRTELAGDFAGYRVTTDATELAACNKVLSTSTVLLNDTLDDILGHCSGAQWFALIGPSAGCLPDHLFARGVTLLGGAWVSDPAAFKEALVAVRSWGEHARKCALQPTAYPGFERLLSMLA
jgi:uncharacterized protein (DUF4213/DUF364 family)